jgi:hypothetical protein
VFVRRRQSERRAAGDPEPPVRRHRLQGGQDRAGAAVIETISHGDQVDIASLIPASGYTIVEFEADF